MKVITITGTWLNSFAKIERPVRVNQVFKLADENHWEIRIKGMHYSNA
jgi:hypothetical protein